MRGVLHLIRWSGGVVPQDMGTLLAEFEKLPEADQVWEFTTKRDPDTPDDGAGSAFVVHVDARPTGERYVYLRSLVNGTLMSFRLEIEQ